MRGKRWVSLVGCWVSRILRIGCAAGLMLVGVPAHAVYLTGSFSGVAFDSERIQGIEMYGDFDGKRVFGTFGFEAETTSTPAPASLTFRVPGIASYDFSDRAFVQFLDTGTRQSIEILALGDIAYASGSLILSGPPGSLSLLPSQGGISTGIDLTTFDPTSIVLGSARADFGQRRGPSGSVRLDRLRFDKYRSVPEPATLALFGIGLLGVLMLSRKGPIVAESSSLSKPSA
jgi:hypothetical protein